MIVKKQGKTIRVPFSGKAHTLLRSVLLSLSSYLSLLRSRRRLLPYLILLALALGVFTLLRTPQTAEAGWYDDTYQYRIPIYFENTGAAIDAERRVLLEIDTATLISAGKMQSDCDDSRFVYGGTLAEYYITGDSCNESSTSYYVTIPTVAAGPNVVWLYYGNDAASSGASAAPGVDTTNLVSWWDFDESSGNRSDSHTNGYTLSDINTVGTATAKIGDNAAQFVSSNNEYLVTNTTDSPELAFGDQDFSVVTWINPTTVTRQTLLNIDGLNTIIRMEATGRLLMTMDGQQLYPTDTNLVTAGSWYMVAFTFDQSTGRRAISSNAGTELTDTFSGTHSTASGDVYIGVQSATANLLNSALDEYSIWNTALSDTDLDWLYNSGSGRTYEDVEAAVVTPVFSPAATPTTGSEEVTPQPVAYWRFDEGYGSTTQDHTGNDHDGSVTGAEWQTQDLCVSDKCLLFDGADDYVSVSTSVTDIQSVSFWVRPTSTTEQFIDLNGSAYIEASSGTVSATGFTSPTIYVNGIVSSTITASEWQHITVTTGTALTGSAVRLGRIGSNYGQAFMDEVKIYPYARTAAQIKADYNARGSAIGASAVLGAAANKNLSEGLVGYWAMDETTDNSCSGGEDSCDSSGSENHGTWLDGANKQQGKYGNGVDLDGASDAINFGSDQKLDNLEAFTYSVWMYYEGGGNAGTIGKRANDNNGFAFFPDGSEQYRATIGDGSTFVAAGGIPVPQDEWVHVTITFDLHGDRKLHIYENGEWITSSSANSGSLGDDSSANLYLGSRSNDIFLDGQVDEFRIYNRALSPAEVRQLYNWAPGPVAHYKFDENTGTSTVEDSSGNDNQGSFNGAMTEADWVPGKFGSALDFDGSDDYVRIPSVLGLGTTNVSVNAWVYLDSASESGSFVKVGTTSNGYSLGVGSGTHDSDGNQLIMLYEGVRWISTVSNIGTGWHHVGMTIDSTGIPSAYIDGTFIGSYSGTNANTPTSQIDIGGNNPGSYPRFVDGIVDDVRIYNYARTQKQIIQDMNAGHPTGGSPIASQTVYYDFNEQQGSTANNRNSTQSTVTGSISGATWKTARDCKLNGCLDYDGTDDVTTVTNATAIDLNDNLAAGFTFSTWVYVDSDGENDVGQIFQKGTNTYLRVDSESGGSVDLEGSLDLATSDATLNLSAALTTGTWHHVAMSYTDDGDDEITLWVNGVNKGSSSDGDGAPASDSNNLLIGGTTTANFDGKIDEFKLYSSELTQDEILIDYNLGAAATYSTGNIEEDNLIDGAGSAPIGEWKMDEGTGVTTADTSGNSNTGSLIGPVWENAGSCKYGNCLNFDGTDDYVALGDLGLTSGTLSMWLKPTETSGTVDRRIFSPSSGHVGLEGSLSINPISQVNDCDDYDVCVWPGVSPWKRVIDLDSDWSNEWHHIVVVFDSGSATGYFDGVEHETATSDFEFNGTVAMLGGKFLGAFGNTYSGNMDHVKVYNYALTQSQVSYEYNRGKPLAHWKLDECSGTTANDWSGNALHGIIAIGGSGDNTSAGTCGSGTGTEAWNNGTTGKYNYSLDFDGTDDYIDLGTNSILTVGGGDHTVSVWAKWTQSTGNARAFLNLGAESDDVALSTGFGASGQDKVSYYVQDLGGSNWCYNAGSGLNDGNWHHILATREASTVTIYVDGVATTCLTGSAAAGAFNHIGGGAYDYFDGQVDDVRIYSYPLSADQVKRLYNNDSSAWWGPESGAP